MFSAAAESGHKGGLSAEQNTDMLNLFRLLYHVNPATTAVPDGLQHGSQQPQCGGLPLLSPNRPKPLLFHSSSPVWPLLHQNAW